MASDASIYHEYLLTQPCVEFLGRGGVLYHYGSCRRIKCGERMEEWRDDLSFSVAALFGVVGSENIEGAADVTLVPCCML